MFAHRPQRSFIAYSQHRFLLVSAQSKWLAAQGPRQFGRHVDLDEVDVGVGKRLTGQVYIYILQERKIQTFKDEVEVYLDTGVDGRGRG